MLATARLPLLFTRRNHYRAEVMIDAPVGYWRLGESSGTSAADSSGNGNTGTYTGGVTLGQAGALAAEPDGTSDTAALFDGSNDYVDAGDIAAMNFTTNSFTVEAWVYPTVGGTYRVVVGKGKTASASGWRCFINNSNKPVLFWGTDSDSYDIPSTASIVVTTNAWNHVVWGYDAAAGKVFYAVNGAYQAITAANHSVTNSDSVRIGIDSGLGYIVTGTIDEVTVYPTALGAARIAAHYRAATS